MKEPTLGSPQNTIAVLQKYNFVFQKKFGQNFLIDTHVLSRKSSGRTFSSTLMCSTRSSGRLRSRKMILSSRSVRG